MKLAPYSIRDRVLHSMAQSHNLTFRCRRVREGENGPVCAEMFKDDC